MKKLSCLLILTSAVFINLSHSETHIPGGEISGIWSLSGSPYYIEGVCLITMINTLEIEPGVQVLMEPEMRIRIEGQLLAVGTATDSINFTAIDTAHGCGGLDFLNLNQNSMDSSKLVFCEISYGIGCIPPNQYWHINFMHGGGLYIDNSSKILLSHCLITHNRTMEVIGMSGLNGSWPGAPGEDGHKAVSGNGGVIYLHNSDIEINNCIFSNNSTGNALGGNGGNGADKYMYNFSKGGFGGKGGLGASGSGGAIFCSNSSPIISCSKFLNNGTGSAFGGHGGDGGEGSSENWDSFGGLGGDGENGISGFGGAIYFIDSSSEITNNLFAGNFTGIGNGGNGGAGGDGVVFMAANTGYGGDGGDGGGGKGGDGSCIFAKNSFPTLQNNTITLNENGSGIGSLGGIGGQGDNGGSNGDNGSHGAALDGFHIIQPTENSSLTMTNSIIFDNSDPSINGNCTIDYSCIEGGYAGTGNINADPLFAQNPLGDYFLSHLSAGQTVQSPCIDAGCPDSSMITGTTRTDLVQDAGIVDMGYHYPIGMQTLGFSYDQAIQLEFNLFSASPNPFNPTTTISFELRDADLVKLTIYDIAGRETKTLVDGFQLQGLHEITFDASDLASGMYFAILEAGDFQQTRKLLLIK